MIQEVKNVEMLKDGELVCVFRTLREAANCMVSVGITSKVFTAKSMISKATSNNSKVSTAYGFEWRYLK